MSLFPGVPSYINGRMNPEYRKKYRKLNPDYKRKFWVRSPYPVARKQQLTGQRSEVTPTSSDIAWAAGIYEGEGWCGNTKHRKTQSGSFHLRFNQKDPWVCYKFLSLFGGSLYGPYEKKNITTWGVSGARARGIAYTLFSFLSPRRRSQIKAALGV